MHSHIYDGFRLAKRPLSLWHRVNSAKRFRSHSISRLDWFRSNVRFDQLLPGGRKTSCSWPYCWDYRPITLCYSMPCFIFFFKHLLHPHTPCLYASIDGYNFSISPAPLSVLVRLYSFPSWHKTGTVRRRWRPFPFSSLNAHLYTVNSPVSLAIPVLRLLNCFVSFPSTQTKRKRLSERRAIYA